MSENSGAGDKYGAMVHSGNNNNFAEATPGPRFIGDFACYGKNEAGEVVKMWETPWSNSVVNQGRNYILNRLFASWVSYSNGALLFLHSATLASNNVWSQISASQVVSYGNSIPAITFSTVSTAPADVGQNSMSATASYAFNASTQTVSGAGILFYSSASGGTNLATNDARLYCYGTFAASQLVQNGNTLSATVTVSFQSA